MIDGDEGSKDEAGRWSCERCLGVRFVYAMVDGVECVQPCGCRPEVKARNRDPLDLCGIRNDWQTSFSLSRFSTNTEVRRQAFEQVMEYYESFPAKGEDVGNGLVLWGGTNTGKTHLAVGLLIELVRNKHVFGMYWDFKALVKKIKKSYDAVARGVDIRPLEYVIEAEFLVIDDIGSLKLCDWEIDTIFQIIDGRYRLQLPTVMCTRYEDGDRDAALRADWNRREEFLIERVGQATRSRLLEMCAFIPTESPSARRQRLGQKPPSTMRAIRRWDQDRGNS